MGIETMRTYKRKTRRGDTPVELMMDAVNQVVIDGRSIYRVLNLDLSRHTLARYVKMPLEDQAIFELKTKFSHGVQQRRKLTCRLLLAF